MPQLPRYQTTEDIPTPNGMLLKGAVIEVDGPGAPHYIPLNDEARQHQDDFWNEEYTYKVLNERTGEFEERKHRPRLAQRPPEQGGTKPVHNPITVIAEAAPPERGKSLAELINTRATPNIVAPKPDQATVVRQEFVQETPLDDGTTLKVLEPAAKPPADPRKPNIQSSRTAP